MEPPKQPMFFFSNLDGSYETGGSIGQSSLNFCGIPVVMIRMLFFTPLSDEQLAHFKALLYCSSPSQVSIATVYKKSSKIKKSNYPK